MLGLEARGRPALEPRPRHGGGLEVRLRGRVGLADRRVERVEGGYAVHLHAETLVRDLVIESTRLWPDTETDDQLVTLLPGERRTLFVRADGDVEPERLMRAPVMQCMRSVPMVDGGSA